MTHVQDCVDCHKTPFNSTNVTKLCTVNAVDYNKTAEEGAIAQEAAAVQEAKAEAKAEVTQVTAGAVSTATTMAAVTATVSASVGALAGTVAKAAGSAASAAGSAAGGAGGGAGGGAVSGLMGAQRINLYGDLAGGGQAIEEVAAKGVQTNPMMASFGIFGTGSARRRRLGTKSNEVQDYLLIVLGDAAVSLLLIVAAVVVLHGLIVAYWRYKVNRKFYEQAGKEGEATVKFYPLPSTLAFPNLELMLFTAFMTGLMKNTFVVYGTYAGDFEFDSTLWVVTAIISVLLFSFFAFYTFELFMFGKKHVDLVWKPATGTETTDPVLRFLNKATMGLVKPGPRMRGGFAPPEGWTAAEPARTERLSAPFLCCVKRLPESKEFEAGLKQEQLASWIGDGTGTLKYKMVLLLLQTSLAFVIAVFSVLKTKRVEAKNWCFVLILCIQVSTMIWHVAGQPNDRLKGLVQALGALLEVVVIALTFASTLASDWNVPDTAAALGKLAPSLMLYVTLLPLVLEFYDSLFIPVLNIIKAGKSNGDSTRKIIIGLVFLPILLLLKIFKIGGAASGSMSKLGTVANKTAKKTKVTTKELDNQTSSTLTQSTALPRPSIDAARAGPIRV